MKINHRIALEHDDPFWLEVDRLGLEYKRGDSNNMFSVLEITQDEPGWPEVERLVGEHRPVSHFVSNIFTKRELDASSVPLQQKPMPTADG